MEIPFRAIESDRLSNPKYLVRILLFLATALQPCRTEWRDWTIHYTHQRIYGIEPGLTRLGIDVNYKISYPSLSLLKHVYVEPQSCLPVGEYRNDTMGYAVCSKEPYSADIETLVKDTVTNNITDRFLNCYASSGIERSFPVFQCMRFFIQILGQERDVRVANLTVTPCPELTVASLLYPYPHLYLIQIYGLPLEQDSSNTTPPCPMSPYLVVLDLQNNGLINMPFSSCPKYLGNVKTVFLESQQLRLNGKPIFPLSNRLQYLSLCHCSLYDLPRSTFAGLIHLKMLNISNNDISSLPEGLFDDLAILEQLHIENNALTTLDMSVFERLKNLVFLYLSGNHLTSIDGTLVNMRILAVIDLSNNNLTMVKKNIFRDSPALTLLILDHNNISEIEVGAFFNMRDLQGLALNQNVLTYVNPCSWFDAVTKIRYLLLAHNKIINVEGPQCLSHISAFVLFGNELSTIPPLSNLDNLFLLDLGRNAIHTVSGKEIALKPSLRNMYLDGNEMLTLGVFDNSNSIESLFLNLNNLTHIPAFCFNGLHSLITVNLSSNYIEYVGAFAFPENLQELGLNNNELSDFNSINQSLPQLHILELRGNSLAKFIIPHINVPRVVYIDISENPLEYFSLELCTKMSLLQVIFLEKLGIDIINPDVFGPYGCHHWRHVSFARNRIREINHNSIFEVHGGIDYSHNLLKSIPRFYGLDDELQYLSFNNCSIESIAPMAFQQMTALHLVELKGNKIEYFPQMSSGRIRYDLEKNPIVCSCHLRWLFGHPERWNYMFTKCIDPVTGSVEDFDNLPLGRFVCQHEINCARECICYGVNISTASIVKCSSRSLTTIPLGLSPEASVIYLDHNQFGKPRFPNDMGEMAANQLYLQNSKIYILEQDLFASFPLLHVIDLSYNELKVLNMGLFHSQHALETLFLHGNHIHQIYGGAAGYDWPNLQIITLHGNELNAVSASLNHSVASASFINLTLAGNPWECAVCAGPIFREWLAQHAGIVSDAADIRCNKSHLPVLDINMDTLEYARCVNDTRTLTNSHWAITAGLTITFVLLVTSLVLTYCFRDHIIVILLNKFDFVKRRRRELDVLYDVRVIYDELDERVRHWVVEELLQVLEVNWGHDVFLVERDMLAGGNHAEEIAQSIRQSRRTVIVVSQNFVDNEWAQFAYQAAFQFQIENNRHRVLVVAWEPVETDRLEYSIKVYFETKQVMWRTSRRFWSVLKSKLPLGKRPNTDIQLNLLSNDWNVK